MKLWVKRVPGKQKDPIASLQAFQEGAISSTCEHGGLGFRV